MTCQTVPPGKRLSSALRRHIIDEHTDAQRGGEKKLTVREEVILNAVENRDKPASRSSLLC